MTRDAFDVVVAGGGPGGSTVATFLAMEGYRVLLLETKSFPRYHIGESLMVSTVQGICSSIGIHEELTNYGFVKKPSGVFRWGEGDDLWNLSFTQAQQLNEKNSNYALHVERAVFDQLLLNNARKKGVLVRENSAVYEAIVCEDRIVGIRYRSSDGKNRIAYAHYVVDASGNSSPLFSTVGKRVFSKFFQNIALFCYFVDADRLPSPLEGGGISEAFNDGWMWFLPLNRKLTSVGVIFGSEQRALLEGDREMLMRSFIDACPHLRRLLAPSQRMTGGDYGKFRVRSDFSYTNQRFWRPGLALIGDAACFLDPLFTTGVHLATYAGLLMARSINAVLRDEVEETTAFEEFEYRYRLEFELFYNYVIAFYDMQLGEGFWHSRKVENSGELHNPEFIKLMTSGRDEPTDYFMAKRGIGARAQAFVRQLKKAEKHDEKIAISRAMAEEIHAAFQPKSGSRPFHLGFEDIRTMTWGRKPDNLPRLPVSPWGLIPTENGRSWRYA
jgi:halogenation protein CepH